MAFLHGKGTDLLIGANDLSGYFTSADDDASVASHDTTTFGKDTIAREAGLRDGKVSLSGLYDATADGIIAAFLGSANGEVFTVVPGGATAVGDHCRLGKVRQTTYKASTPVGGMITTSLSLEANEVYQANGRVLHLGAETATGNEASVDNAALSSNGGVATIHCTVFTGTSLDVKLQHSTNDADWVDLSPTFTQLAAVGSEQITVAAGTTVNRYVREYHTIVGTTMTYLVAFARR